MTTKTPSLRTNASSAGMLKTILLAGLLAIAFWVADTPYGHAEETRMVVEVGKGLQLGNTAEAESVFIADPSIADITASPGQFVYVYGKTAGETSLVGVDVAGNTLFEYDLVVIHNLSELQDMLARRFPNERVNIDSARGSLYLSGTVSDTLVHQNIVAALQTSVPNVTVIDEIVVARGPTIELKLQFVEVSRTRLERYGIEWSALSATLAGRGSAARKTEDIAGLLNLLIQNGVATIATESILSTVDKKKATFTVGEEIAIPAFSTSPTGGTERFGIEYKSVGLSVDFLPTLIEGQKVSLEINSEISSVEPSSQSINGNSFPNLAARRFSANVDLANEQSHVITGLSRLDTTASVQKPHDFFGGDLLRRLLGRDTIETTQRDLLVIVTPYFGEADTRQAGDIIPAHESNLEYLLSIMAGSGKGSGSGGGRRTVDIHGQAGFLY